MTLEKKTLLGRNESGIKKESLNTKKRKKEKESLNTMSGHIKKGFYC